MSEKMSKWRRSFRSKKKNKKKDVESIPPIEKRVAASSSEILRRPGCAGDPPAADPDSPADPTPPAATNTDRNLPASAKGTASQCGPAGDDQPTKLQVDRQQQHLKVYQQCKGAGIDRASNQAGKEAGSNRQFLQGEEEEEEEQKEAGAIASRAAEELCQNAAAAVNFERSINSGSKDLTQAAGSSGGAGGGAVASKKEAGSGKKKAFGAMRKLFSKLGGKNKKDKSSRSSSGLGQPAVGTSAKASTYDQPQNEDEAAGFIPNIRSRSSSRSRIPISTNSVRPPSPQRNRKYGDHHSVGQYRTEQCGMASMGDDRGSRSSINSSNNQGGTRTPLRTPRSSRDDSSSSMVSNNCRGPATPTPPLSKWGSSPKLNRLHDDAVDLGGGFKVTDETFKVSGEGQSETQQPCYPMRQKHKQESRFSRRTKFMQEQSDQHWRNHDWVSECNDCDYNQVQNPWQRGPTCPSQGVISRSEQNRHPAEGQPLTVDSPPPPLPPRVPTSIIEKNPSGGMNSTMADFHSGPAWAFAPPEDLPELKFIDDEEDEESEETIQKDFLSTSQPKLPKSIENLTESRRELPPAFKNLRADAPLPARPWHPGRAMRQSQSENATPLIQSSPTTPTRMDPNSSFNHSAPVIHYHVTIQDPKDAFDVSAKPTENVKAPNSSTSFDPTATSCLGNEVTKTKNDIMKAKTVYTADGRQLKRLSWIEVSAVPLEQLETTNHQQLSQIDKLKIGRQGPGKLGDEKVATKSPIQIGSMSLGVMEATGMINNAIEEVRQSQRNLEEQIYISEEAEKLFANESEVIVETSAPQVELPSRLGKTSNNGDFQNHNGNSAIDKAGFPWHSKGEPLKQELKKTKSDSEHVTDKWNSKGTKGDQTSSRRDSVKSPQTPTNCIPRPKFKPGERKKAASVSGSQTSLETFGSSTSINEQMTNKRRDRRSRRSRPVSNGSQDSISFSCHNDKPSVTPSSSRSNLVKEDTKVDGSKTESLENRTEHIVTKEASQESTKKHTHKKDQRKATSNQEQTKTVKAAVLRPISAEMVAETIKSVQESFSANNNATTPAGDTAPSAALRANVINQRTQRDDDSSLCTECRNLRQSLSSKPVKKGNTSSIPSDIVARRRADFERLVEPSSIDDEVTAMRVGPDTTYYKHAQCQTTSPVHTPTLQKRSEPSQSEETSGSERRSRPIGRVTPHVRRSVSAHSPASSRRAWDTSSIRRVPTSTSSASRLQRHWSLSSIDSIGLDPAAMIAPPFITSRSAYLTSIHDWDNASVDTELLTLETDRTLFETERTLREVELSIQESRSASRALRWAQMQLEEDITLLGQNQQAQSHISSSDLHHQNVPNSTSGLHRNAQISALNHHRNVPQSSSSNLHYSSRVPTSALSEAELSRSVDNNRVTRERSEREFTLRMERERVEREARRRQLRLESEARVAEISARIQAQALSRGFGTTQYAAPLYYPSSNRLTSPSESTCDKLIRIRENLIRVPGVLILGLRGGKIAVTMSPDRPHFEPIYRFMRENDVNMTEYECAVLARRYRSHAVDGSTSGSSRFAQQPIGSNVLVR